MAARVANQNSEKFPGAKLSLLPFVKPRPKNAFVFSKFILVSHALAVIGSALLFILSLAYIGCLACFTLRDPSNTGFLIIWFGLIWHLAAPANAVDGWKPSKDMSVSFFCALAISAIRLAAFFGATSPVVQSLNVLISQPLFYYPAMLAWLWLIYRTWKRACKRATS